MRRTVLLLVVLGAAAAWAGDVVFCAPPELREALSAELTAHNRHPVDLSEVDDALFGTNGGEGAKALVAAGKKVQLPPAVPEEVRADFAKGLAGCKARKDTSADARRACAEHLVEAVWQRLLDRLRPEKVIEVKVMAKGESKWLAQLAVYGPQDATIGGGVVKAVNAKDLAARAAEALERKLRPAGGRPNVSELPGPKPPPAASLSQGSPQSLEALPLPSGCRLPATLVVEPERAPLAVTTVALWKASVTAAHRDEQAAPVRCTLDLAGPAAKPSSVVFMCGSSLFEVDLYAGTGFGDAAFQAMLARSVVGNVAAARCARR